MRECAVDLVAVPDGLRISEVVSNPMGGFFKRRIAMVGSDGGCRSTVVSAASLVIENSSGDYGGHADPTGLAARKAPSTTTVMSRCILRRSSRSR